MSGQVTALRLRKLEGRRFNSGEWTIEISGRMAWALGRLLEAGAHGCSPLSEPAGPRWASYVHRLRGFGISIETINTPHGGAYAGMHARYVLTSNIEVISDERAVA